MLRVNMRSEEDGEIVEFSVERQGDSSLHQWAWAIRDAIDAACQYDLLNLVAEIIESEFGDACTETDEICKLRTALIDAGIAYATRKETT